MYFCPFSWSSGSVTFQKKRFVKNIPVGMQTVLYCSYFFSCLLPTVAVLVCIYLKGLWVYTKLISEIIHQVCCCCNVLLCVRRLVCVIFVYICVYMHAWARTHSYTCTHAHTYTLAHTLHKYTHPHRLTIHTHTSVCLCMRLHIRLH